MADLSPPRTAPALASGEDSDDPTVRTAKAASAATSPVGVERGVTMSLFGPDDWPEWQPKVERPARQPAAAEAVGAGAAVSADDGGSSEPAPRDRMAQPGDAVLMGAPASASAQPAPAASPAQWLSNPGGAFVAWLRSPTANRGRGFSDESMRVYAAMWGKFVRFAVEHGASAALANEGVLRAFLDALGQERIAQAHALPVSGRTVGLGRGPGAAAPQAARSRDSGGVGRQARRYLSLLSRLQAHLMEVGVRSDNPALVLWAHYEAEPDRPDPSALPPGSDQKLRAALAPPVLADLEAAAPPGCGGGAAVEASAGSTARAVPAEPHWRDLRDRAIVELLVGSGLTSRQLRALRDDPAHIDLDGSPAWVVPVPARRGQPHPGRVPLSPDAAAAVRLWIDVRRDRIPGDVLFPSNLRGDALSAAALYRAVADAMRHAQDTPDVPAAAHVGPRTLRHTFAIRQLRAGKPLDVLQRWLGHRHLKATAVYERLVPDPKGVKPV